MKNLQEKTVLLCSGLLFAITAHGQEPFFGIDHSPLGSATLSSGAESHDRLVISNIGSSGKDGVELHTGPSDGIAVFIDPSSCPESFGDGSMLELLIAPPPLAEGFASYSADIETVGGQWGATVQNLGNPSACFDTFVYQGRELVGTASCAAFGSIAAQWSDSACPRALGWIQYDDGPGFGVVVQEPTAFSLVGGEQFTGDEIRFLPQGQAEIDIESYRLTAANIDPVILDDELLQKFGNLHHAEGDARMFPTTNNLPLANLGNSGNDGVSMEEVDSFFKEFVQVYADPDPDGTAVQGARMVIQGRGLVEGDPDAALGTMILTKSATGITTEVDNSWVNSSSSTLELYMDGSLVFSAPGQTGVFVEVSDWPAFLGYQSSGFPPEPQAFLQGFAAPVLVTLLSETGRGALEADEIRIVAEDATPVGGLAQFTLRTAGLPLVTIVNEKGLEIDDADLDGVADVFDNCVEVPNNDQTDTNGDGIGNICDGDIAGPEGGPEDCFVNFPDLDRLAEVFFTNSSSPLYDPDADFNSDLFINFLDLDLMRDFFFLPPGPSATGCN